jgi:hypothetical protein
MKLRTCAWLLAVGLASTPLQAAPPAAASLTVQGVLQMGEFLGPPGDGDNPARDQPAPSYYLQLPAPLLKQVRTASQLAQFSQPAQTTSFLQLVVFDEEQSVARNLVGKKVRIVGTVVESDSGQHHTPALIQVKSVSAIRDWQW